MELFSYLSSFVSLTNIPVCVIENGVFFVLSEEDKAYKNELQKLDSYILHQSEDFLWINGLMMFYKCTYQDKTIILGPSLSYLPTETSALATMLSSKMLLNNNEAEFLCHHLIQNKTTNYNLFRNSINLISIALLGKEYSLNIPETISHQEANPERQMIESEESEWINYNQKYMQTVQYYIKNGLDAELLQLFQTEKPAPYGTLGPTELRHYKNSMMIHIYIMRCAAHEGGVDEELCLRLAEAYSQQCEAANSVHELMIISRKLRLDFCLRAKKAQSIKVTSLPISKAIRYIHDHRTEKLNAQVLSNALEMSTSYLCSLFKSETGMSIVDYIQREKISYAKKLLLFSDDSLSTIASNLSFSSQSYFQAIFKKIEGCTPTQFKNSF